MKKMFRNIEPYLYFLAYAYMSTLAFDRLVFRLAHFHPELWVSVLTGLFTGWFVIPIFLFSLYIK